MKMREFAEQSKAWPLKRRKVVARIEGGAQEAIFETGYGASGLPIWAHLAVVRTSMVRHAFSILAPDIATRLALFR